MLVVFDRSGSMGEPWDDGRPRYEVAGEAVEAAIAPLAPQLSVGAISFPSMTDATGWCGTVDPVDAQIPYTDGPDFLDAWRSTWMGLELLGSTPIDQALEAADLSLPDDGVVTAVVLLTDGEPTCEGDVPAVDRARAWVDRGVRTWVVGLPGTEGSTYLAALARAGGTGAPIAPADAGALTEGLGAALGEAVDQACAR